MATTIANYTKLFIVLQNKPNTVWLSRMPDMTRHILTIRPRYVEEYLGTVAITSDIVNNQCNMIVDQNHVDFGFEVQNQYNARVMVDVYHNNTKIDTHLFQVEECYLFRNNALTDKRPFNIDPSITIQSEYSFVVDRVYGEWPHTRGFTIPREIKIPHVETPDRQPISLLADGWSYCKTPSVAASTKETFNYGSDCTTSYPDVPPTGTGRRPSAASGWGGSTGSSSKSFNYGASTSGWGGSTGSSSGTVRFGGATAALGKGVSFGTTSGWGGCTEPSSGTSSSGSFSFGGVSPISSWGTTLVGTIINTTTSALGWDAVVPTESLSFGTAPPNVGWGTRRSETGWTTLPAVSSTAPPSELFKFGGTSMTSTENSSGTASSWGSSSTSSGWIYPGIVSSGTPSISSWGTSTGIASEVKAISNMGTTDVLPVNGSFNIDAPIISKDWINTSNSTSTMPSVLNSTNSVLTFIVQT